jgi:hypothetical protein
VVILWLVRTPAPPRRFLRSLFAILRSGHEGAAPVF